MPEQNQELGPGAEFKLLEIEAGQQQGVLQANDGKSKLQFKRNKNQDIEYMVQLQNNKIHPDLLFCMKMTMQEHTLTLDILNMAKMIDITDQTGSQTQTLKEMRWEISLDKLTQGREAKICM